jgi:putative ABC transport system ATP-binding protein
MTAIVSLTKVSKSYTRGKQQVVVLRDLDLSIEEGDFAALMGPSGSGKTTLLNLIGGLDQPTSGSITVAGQQLEKLNSKADRKSVV